MTRSVRRLSPRSLLAHCLLAPCLLAPCSLATGCVLAAAAGAAAQQTCSGFGSTPVPAAAAASPLPLGCAWAPRWPQWHLLTPPHRAPAPHPGFDPGDAKELPGLLVVYRCTGFLLLPVVVDRVRCYGYVIDQPERACAPG